MVRFKIPRFLIVAVAALCLLAAAVPITAFVIIPHFVRSTVHEPMPAMTQAAIPSVGATDAPVAVLTPTLLASGALRKVDAVHFGSGQVSVFDLGGARYLRFEGVAIAGAPNMFVYLSDRSDGLPGNFSDLGPLKATDGSFNYQLPDGLDLSRVHSVVVWCRAFSVTVTYAVLG